jgi:hypothetical protein
MWQCNAHKVSLELTSERIRHYLATKNSEAWLKGDWNVCNPIHLRLLSTVGLFSLASGWVRRASPVLRELLGARPPFGQLLTHRCRMVHCGEVKPRQLPGVRQVLVELGR